MFLSRTSAGNVKTLHRLATLHAPAPLELVLLKHGVERHIGEDEVVQHGDAQQLARAFEPSGDITVIGAGGEVPAGVVVGDDDGGGPFTQGISKYFHLCVTSGTIKLLLLGIENSYIM